MATKTTTAKTVKAGRKTKVAASRGKTALAKKATVFTCKTCGATTTKRSHLCAPRPTETAYMCAYCGKTAGDARHVCSPMLAEMKYSCKSCGRVTPFRSAVCSPVVIR